jgi:hypothetical protein
VKLTREERKRILAGDYSALKRDENPGEVEGLELPIVRDLARRQLIFKKKEFSDHQPGFQDTREIPEYWWLWIKLGKETRHRKGYWHISFTVHDQRQKERTLRAGGPPGAPREPGLRTRQRDKPRPKGEGVGSYTDETARGYGAGGRQILDYGGVDDDELRRQRVMADKRFAEHRREVASETERRQQERHVRRELRETLSDLDIPAQTALLAGVERLIREANPQNEKAA